MNRRDALKALIGSIGAGAFAVPALGGPCQQIAQYGATPPTREIIRRSDRRPRRRFYDRFATMRNVSTGKDVRLYANLQKQLGTIEPHYQGPAPDGSPGEGDCVGQAGALGCDVLTATEIHQFGEPERWLEKASVEMCYAGSRVEIGGNSIPPTRAGSHGEWMVRFLKEYGVLHRIEYEREGNTLDLTGYHPQRSRDYRGEGVPDWLEPIAREHPVREFTNVRSAAEALDAVAAGQPVLLCSSYAFKNVRDAEGFCEPHLGQRRRTRRGWVDDRIQWWHCMLLVASLRARERQGGTICNSHGRWNEGPQPDGMPDGSFNVDVSTLDLMVKDWFDCYAISSYQGHEAARRKHRLY